MDIRLTWLDCTLAKVSSKKDVDDTDDDTDDDTEDIADCVKLVNILEEAATETLPKKVNSKEANLWDEDPELSIGAIQKVRSSGGGGGVCQKRTIYTKLEILPI